MVDVTTDDTADVMTAYANLSRSSQDKIACTLKNFVTCEKSGVVRLNLCADLVPERKSGREEALTRTRRYQKNIPENIPMTPQRA